MNQFQISYPFDVYNFIVLQEAVYKNKISEIEIECFNPNHTHLYTFDNGKLIKHFEKSQDGYMYSSEYTYDIEGRRIKGVEKLVGEDIDKDASHAILNLIEYQYDKSGKLIQEVKINPTKVVPHKTKRYSKYDGEWPSVVEEFHDKKIMRTLFYKGNRLIKIETRWGITSFIWKENLLEIIKTNKKIISKDSFYFESKKLVMWQSKNGFQNHEFIYNKKDFVEQVYKNKQPWIQVNYI